jgi:hypothetical protein
MVALVAGAAKLPHDAARDAMGLAMIAVGFLTVLQSLRLGGVGSGYLCPPVVKPAFRPARSSLSLYGLEPSFMIPFAIAGLASRLRVVGVLTTCQQMNDAAFRRPDMKNIEAGTGGNQGEQRLVRRQGYAQVYWKPSRLAGCTPKAGNG